MIWEIFVVGDFGSMSRLSSLRLGFCTRQHYSL